MNLPAPVDAERAVNGSILLRPDAIVEVADTLQPGDFYDEGQRLIYAAAMRCYETQTAPDIRTIAEALRKAKTLDRIGGLITLANLSDDVPTSYHIDHYAAIVVEASRRRKLLDASGKIAKLACDERKDVDAIEAEAQSALMDATDRDTESGPAQISDSMTRLHLSMQEKNPPGIPTGWVDYDALTGGLQPGALVIVAGRPGMGKSAWALSTAVRLAERGQRVQIYSLEMPEDECSMRLVSQVANVPFVDIRARSLDAYQAEQVASAMATVDRWPMMIDPTPSLEMQRLRARALRDKARYGQPALVIVDYLQLVTYPGTDNRLEEVSKVSRACKALAKELKCTVMALAQLSREQEKRGSPVPKLSDLRESGQIEADADIVLCPIRPELYDKSAVRGLAEGHIIKQRGGPTGIIPAVFDGPTMAYRARSTYSAPEGY